MKLWLEDSDFNVDVGDIIAAHEDEWGNKWSFEVLELNPFTVQKRAGEDLLDGCKQMFGEIVFTDKDGTQASCLLHNWGEQPDSFIFHLVV